MSGRRPGRFLLLAATAGLWLSAPFPAAAEPVSVRAGAHEEYGRIVFNWKAPVAYSARLRERILVVRFARPIEAAYDGVLRTLRRYLGGATPGADGRSVSFALKGDFGLRDFDMGSAVVIDLLAGREVEDASSPAAIDRPAGTPLVRVRTGEHEGYTRIVFDWPRKVAYRVARAGGTATVTFDRRARVDLRRLKARPPRFVRDASAAIGDDSLSVTLKVGERSRLRHFVSGSKVVIDVMAPSPEKAPPEPAKTAAAGDAPRPAPPPAASAERTGQESAAAPAATQPGAGPAPPKGPSAPGAAASAAPLGKPKPLSPQGQPATAAAGAPPIATGPLAEVSGDAIALRFDWDEPVAAAAFRRAGALWVVFDKASAPDLAVLSAQAGNAVRSIRQVPVLRATALRLDTVSGVNPNLRRDGLTWIVELRKQPMRTPTPIEVIAEPNSPVGARVFLSVREPGAALAVADPEVGDTLVVVPVIGLGHGVDRQRLYPQFRILQTIQGVAIEPRIDDLNVRPLDRGIELTSPGQLQISAVSRGARADTKVGKMRKLTRVFDLEKLEKDTLADLFRERRKLELAVAQAKNKSRRERRRFELVRFFFANGFAAEALGVMRVMAKERPDIQKKPEFRAMRGAASTLMGHYAEGGADLHHPALQDTD